MPCGDSGGKNVISFRPCICAFDGRNWGSLRLNSATGKTWKQKNKKKNNDISSENSGWKCNNSLYNATSRDDFSESRIACFLPFIAITLLASSRIKFILSISSVCRGMRWMPSGWLLVRCVQFTFSFSLHVEAMRTVRLRCLSSHTFLHSQMKIQYAIQFTCNLLNSI